MPRVTSLIFHVVLQNWNFSYFLFCSICCAGKSELADDIYFCPISGAQQQQPAFKPAGFGATAQPAAISGLFESSTPVLGAATGVAPATSAFGQPQAEPDGKKPLFSLLHILPTVQTVNEVLKRIILCGNDNRLCKKTF